MIYSNQWSFEETLNARVGTLAMIIAMAGEPANFLAAPAPDFFSQAAPATEFFPKQLRFRLLDFFSSGYGSKGLKKLVKFGKIFISSDDCFFNH